ncbi:alpha/beta hydrolase [Paenibacillus sp. OAS669]|uniref:alpha/beta hydrolase n=1 Tax=Paenibacillus sp. OAS669 TaxID=2663821 RepID=UPI0017893BEC|nr:alpha/beta hydrolase family protein [Paenibacillus sp. OAS669]MBE1441883.1 S-formylglutathione hydrolase FrmB [Paenibacillus sp. OAS669]
MSIRPHPFFSGALFARKSCFVYLPDDYETSEDPYPVIYLLHGMYGSESHWLLKGNAETTLNRMMQEGSLRKSIVVFPNDGGYGLGTFYMNWYDGTGNFEDYFIYDLVTEIDKSFRTIPDRAHRVLCGLSMGGFGAFSLALRHPELFGAAASLSGAVTSTAMITNQYSRSDISRMIGPLHGPYAQSYDLQKLADAQLTNSQRPALYFNCGTEDYLYSMNAAYHEQLERIGYQHIYQEFPGEHNWDYWSKHLPDALRFLEASFQQMTDK